MKNKTLLQRLQSRISKRRGVISLYEDEVTSYYIAREFYGWHTISVVELQYIKSQILEEAQSQQLDKRLFGMLLNKQREDAKTTSKYFYSKYTHVKYGAL